MDAQPGSHRISPPSFCDDCLNYSRKKDSTVPSLVDREVYRILCTHKLIILHYLLGIDYVRGNPSCCVTPPSFELTSKRQKVSRLPTEPPGRPAMQHTMSSPGSQLSSTTIRSITVSYVIVACLRSHRQLRTAVFSTRHIHHYSTITLCCAVRYSIILLLYCVRTMYSHT